jgi:hypothetical protein
MMNVFNKSLTNINKRNIHNIKVTKFLKFPIMNFANLTAIERGKEKK